MKLARAHYQQGSLSREKRKRGPDLWVFRWREHTPAGRVKRKVVVGTVEQYPTKAAAHKAVEALRININQESWMPSTLEQLVTHYREMELPRKTPYTQEVYDGFLNTRILPVWGRHGLHDVRTIEVEKWLGTLPLADGTKAKIRNLMHALWEHAVRGKTRSQKYGRVRNGSRRRRF